MSSILSHAHIALLCGGRGERLKCVTHPSIPKALAEVNGKPFIQILLEHLSLSGFRSALLLAGHGSEWLYAALRDKRLNIGWQVHADRELMGTGPALLKALDEFSEISDPLIVQNGDTYIHDLDYVKMLGYHLWTGAMVTVAYNDKANAGAFVISKCFRGVLRDAGEKFNLEDAISMQSEANPASIAWYTVKDFYDIGEPERLEIFREWCGTAT